MIISGEISNGGIQPTSKGKEHGRPIASDEALPILPRAPTLAPNQQVELNRDLKYLHRQFSDGIPQERFGGDPHREYDSVCC